LTPEARDKRGGELVRRIQVNTRGREMMWLRIEARTARSRRRPRRQEHENRAQLEHAGERMRLTGAHELRQECKKEDRQFRMRMLIRMAETIT